MSSSRNKGKEKDFDVEQPLLSPDASDNADPDYDSIPVEPEQEAMRREPFLLEETQACIQILKSLQITAALKTRHTQKTHYGLSLLCTFLILGAFGEAGIMLGLIFAVSAMLNDRLLPKLERQLNNLLEQVNLINAELDREKIKLEEARQSYSDLEERLAPVLKKIDHEFAQWQEGYYDPRPNCQWWIKDDGTPDNIDNYYQGDIYAHGSDEWCWMPRHNVTHPIPRCNTIMNQLCSSMLEEEALEKQLGSSQYALNAAQRAVSATESTLNTLQKNINHIHNELDHPDFKSEPITITLFIISSVAAVALLLGGGYACWRSYRNSQTARAHNDDVNVSITDPDTAERIKNLTTRLGIADLQDMKLQTLINQLTLKANALELRRKQMMAFFAGGLASNTDAKNRKLLDQDKAGDVMRIIYDYAFPKPGI